MDRQVRVGPSRAVGRGASFGTVVGVYLVALGAAVAAGAAVDRHPLTVVAVGMGVATLVVFASSRALNNTSMFDPYWSVAPPVVALYLLSGAEAGVPGVRQAVVTALVFTWGVRLTANWARSWPGLHHEDWRYVEMRTNGRPYWPQSLIGLHLFPTLQIYLGCLALYPALAVGTSDFGVIDGIAVVITAGAVTLETLADEQLRAFNRTKQPGDVCDVGIWAWSRHPNYLGELSFWWGLWLFGLAAATGWWWTVVGPVAMTVMFLAASVPMLERRSAERRPGWAGYARRTSLLVPRPPRA